MTIEQLSDVVREAIDVQGLTVYQVASRVGMERKQSVYRLVNGKPVSLVNALAIMDAVGLRIVPGDRVAGDDGME